MQGACQFLFDDVLCITKNLRKTSVVALIKFMSWRLVVEWEGPNS